MRFSEQTPGGNRNGVVPTLRCFASPCIVFVRCSAVVLEGTSQDCLQNLSAIGWKPRIVVYAKVLERDTSTVETVCWLSCRRCISFKVKEANAIRRFVNEQKSNQCGEHCFLVTRG